MKPIFFILLVFFVFFSCSKKEKSITIEEDNQEDSSFCLPVLKTPDNIYPGDEILKYKYDDEYKLKEIHYDDNGYIRIHELIYDENDLVSHIIEKNTSGKKYFSYDYTYNESNQLIGIYLNNINGINLQKEFSYPDPKIIVKKNMSYDSNPVNLTITTYYFNDHMNCERMTISYPDTSAIQYDIYYTYNDYFQPFKDFGTNLNLILLWNDLSQNLYTSEVSYFYNRSGNLVDSLYRESNTSFYNLNEFGYARKMDYYTIQYEEFKYH